MHLAVKIKNIEIIKLLLIKKGIDFNIIDNKGKIPIDYSKNSEIKQLLSKRHPNSFKWIKFSILL